MSCLLPGGSVRIIFSLLSLIMMSVVIGVTGRIWLGRAMIQESVTLMSLNNNKRMILIGDTPVFGYPTDRNAYCSIDYQRQKMQLILLTCTDSILPENFKRYML